MLSVAQHINEFKRRSELVDNIVSKKKGLPRREIAPSSSSFSRSVSKKLLRAKAAVLGEQEEPDGLFDALSALCDSTRSGVLRFSNEMREWARVTKTSLDSQVKLVEGWVEIYRPVGDETLGGGQERLLVFLESVLRPIIAGPWRDLARRVSLL